MTSNLRRCFAKMFLPGPLETSMKVKESMLYDMSPRDSPFLDYMSEIRNGILWAAQASSSKYAALINPGTGTFGIEACMGTLTQQDSLLILNNGYYGDEMETIANLLEIPHRAIRKRQDQAFYASDIISNMNENTTHISMVHSETTTGLLNPIEEIVQAARSVNSKVKFIVDGVSALGVVPVNLDKLAIDLYISTFNKGLESVPAGYIVIGKIDHFETLEHKKRSHVLDLYQCWDSLKNYNGNIPFTAPVHALLALRQALMEFKEEGIHGRHNRYVQNQEFLIQELEKIGYEAVVPKEIRSPAVSTFYQPDDKRFNLQYLFNTLKERGFIIYPGYFTKLDRPTFRFGTIGRIDLDDVKQIVKEVKDITLEMKVFS